jgi:hypothetical protein
VTLRWATALASGIPAPGEIAAGGSVGGCRLARGPWPPSDSFSHVLSRGAGRGRPPGAAGRDRQAARRRGPENVRVPAFPGPKPGPEISVFR